MLEIKNLSAGVLKNVNLSVADGARHLLRGANGSGKTTLVRAILGNPDYRTLGGEIVFNGINVADMTTAFRVRMGLFIGMQNVPEIPGLSVMTFLKHSYMSHFGAVPAGEFMTKLKQAQIRLDIPDSWLARSVNVGFSGGERKRLMFLRLLLQRPKFAILDEPDSGADEDARKLFGEIIDEMKETTFLIISHQDVFFKPTKTEFLEQGCITKGKAK
ncbi:MAG: ATP-binding cassette domain-containing protein [Rickettsiales bacterium]|jgi:Fe-S cluster assembly ATP-binding protein|nr:ATP-binding cassette domain-containing protein [Rickettsiales bacterium]